jgi:hypothetical protein
MDRTLWQPWRWRRSEAEGGDGRWGCNEVTARRAVPLVDGWRRGRAASSVAVGAVVLLFFCSDGNFLTRGSYFLTRGGGLPRQTFFYPTRRVYLARNLY